jgi:glycerol kinase
MENLRLAPGPKEFDAMAESVSGSGGVSLIPGFSGLGGPYWQMNRKAEILGITFGTQAAHIVRAALEAYPFQLKDVVGAMEQDLQKLQGTTGRLRWIRADGGLTNSKASMQMIADLLQTEVRIDLRHEGSALGAALLGFIGKGVFSLQDAENLINNAPFNTYSPKDAAEELKASYSLWHERVIKGNPGGPIPALKERSY